MRTGVRLAIDVGSVRIGVAACDAAATLSFGIETVPRGAGDIARLVELAHDRGALEVVIGLPLRLDGTVGPAAQAVSDFARDLAEPLHPIPLRVVDERLTTVAAQRGLQGAGRTIRSSRSIIDEEAAVTLLNDALARERATGAPAGEIVTPSPAEGSSS